MKHARSITTMLLLAVCGTTASAQINTPFNDYALAFRVDGQGRTQEVWVTTSRGYPSNARSRQVVVASFAEGQLGAPLALGDASVNVPAASTHEIRLDGAAAFPACIGDRGAFVSNRPVGELSMGNDIYEMRHINGSWQVRRIDEINSSEWDDTPAFSPDGSRLYFSSDRRMPGTRRADLFVSERVGGTWSSPRPLPSINTDEYSEESPFVGPDGYLYFASNRTGDYDIYRVRINDDGMPVGSAESVPFPDVNRPGSNEVHPAFSPGGHWFVYSSNRGPQGRQKDMDVYWMKVHQQRVPLTVNIALRNRVMRDGSWNDELSPMPSAIVVVKSLRTGDSAIHQADGRGNVSIDLSPETGDAPAADGRYQHLIVYALTSGSERISSVDTILADMTCTGGLDHTLLVWDRSLYIDPGCRYDFDIYNVPFFVNGYWCPTTRDYRDLPPCTSLFIEDSCVTGGCASTEIYSTEMVVNWATGTCIDFDDFQNNGQRYATEVDQKIVQLNNAMRSVFEVPCVRRAMSDGKHIKVEIIGLTDPNPLRDHCTYVSSDICFDENSISVGGVRYPVAFREDHRRAYRGCIASGTRFVNGPVVRNGTNYGGNQLLSDLRAIYIGILLDGLWRSQQRYVELRESGQLSVEVRGEAISTEATSYARKRSARVVVTVPELEADFQPTVAESTPGSTVKLCQTCR